MLFEKRLGKLALCAGLLGACACVSQAAPAVVSGKPETHTTTHAKSGSHTTPNHVHPSTSPAKPATTHSSTSPGTSTSGSASSAHKTSDQKLAQALQLLHTMHRTLEMADHDYGGHRDHAMRDIHEAIHELREALEHQAWRRHNGDSSGSNYQARNNANGRQNGSSANQGTSAGILSTSGSGSQGWGNSGTSSGEGSVYTASAEPEGQQVSDQQLANSVPELTQAISLLRQADNDLGGHRDPAVEKLDAAIHQLERALAYSKESEHVKP